MRRTSNMLPHVCSRSRDLASLHPKETFPADARSRSARRRLSLALAVGALAGALPMWAATLTVTNTNDNGTGSLRQAIIDANATGDTIQFASGVTGAITLTTGELLINKSLTITGPGAAQLAVSGGPTSRVFEIGSSATFAISGLTIENGAASGGGGIYNQGTLTLTNSTVSGNTADTGGGEGGGILNSGALTLTNSTLSGNSASTGGGIFTNGTLTIKNTLLANNGTGGNCALPGKQTSQGYNLSDDNTCAAAFNQTGDLNNVVKGAGLDPAGLRNNGGPTPTIALLPGSPAVDHIPTASCTVTTDQRGIARPQGPACDSGAFELVESGPSISKSFAPTTIALNGTTTLSFTVAAPSTNALTSVGFTDTLPSGLAVANPNGLTGSCGAGAITATAGAVSLSGAGLAAGASCTFSVTVVGTTASVQNNTVTATSAQGAGSTLSFTLSNPNTATFLAVSFIDNLPAGLIVATPNGVSSTCPAGAITALPGSSQIVLSGGGIAPASSCLIAVRVTATAVGTLTNTTGAITSPQGGTGNMATATLTVSSDAYQLNYASNLNIADGVLNLTNSGASAGANVPIEGSQSLGNSVGDICANVYVYAPDQELATCCTCLVSPNSLHAYPVIFGPNSLLSNVNNTTALAVINQTHSVLIKLLAVPAGSQGGTAPTCPSPATPGTGVTGGGAITGLAPGLIAWGTHAHPTNTAAAAVTETRFVPATLSAGELGKLTGDCRALLTFGSGQQCPGCLPGGLAAPEALTPKLP